MKKILIVSSIYLAIAIGMHIVLNIPITIGGVALGLLITVILFKLS